MTEATFEFVDRYSATGTPYPSPATVCLGHCEGMGCVPIADPDGKGSARPIDADSPEFIRLWQKAHAERCCPSGVLQDLWRHKEWWFWKSISGDIWSWARGKGYCDGWHFVTCPDCNGTGKRVGTEST